MRKPPGDVKHHKRHTPSRRDASHQHRIDPIVRIPDPGERPGDTRAPWAASDRDIQDRYSSR